MKLEINEDIIKKQLLINEQNDELETLFPSNPPVSSAIIKPIPGFCVKTKDNATQQKAFVNVGTSDAVPAPEDISNDELISILDSDDPTDFRVPMSIGLPHEEQDKSGNCCMAYDIIINPKFFEKLSDNPLFQNFFMVVTIESLDEKYKVSLDKNSWTVLKNKKYLGSLAEQKVRTTLPLIQELSGIKPWTPADFPAESISVKGGEGGTEPIISEIKCKRLEEPQKTKKIPNFSIIKPSKTDPEDEPVLRVEVELPEVVTCGKITVNIGEDRLVVETDRHFLDELVPYSMNGEASKAFFVKDIRVLVLMIALNEKETIK